MSPVNRINPVNTNCGTFTVQAGQSTGGKGSAPDGTKIVLAENRNPITPPVDIVTISSTGNNLKAEELKPYCSDFNDFSEAVIVVKLFQNLKEIARIAREEYTMYFSTPLHVLTALNTDSFLREKAQDLFPMSELNINDALKMISKDLQYLQKKDLNNVEMGYAGRAIQKYDFDNIAIGYANGIIDDLKIYLGYYCAGASSKEDELTAKAISIDIVSNYAKACKKDVKHNPFYTDMGSIDDKLKKIGSAIINTMSLSRDPDLSKLKSVAKDFWNKKIPIPYVLLYEMIK